MKNTKPKNNKQTKRTQKTQTKQSKNQNKTEKKPNKKSQKINQLKNTPNTNNPNQHFIYNTMADGWKGQERERSVELIIYMLRTWQGLYSKPAAPATKTCTKITSFPSFPENFHFCTDEEEKKNPNSSSVGCGMGRCFHGGEFMCWGISTDAFSFRFGLLEMGVGREKSLFLVDKCWEAAPLWVPAQFKGPHLQQHLCAAKH